MPVNISNVALTHTFEYMRQRVNDLASNMSTNVLTVGATQANIAAGNAVVNGSFQATKLVANSIGGSATVPANGAGALGTAANLSITTNTAFLANASIAGDFTVTGNTTASHIAASGNVSANNLTVTRAVSANTLSLTSTLAVSGNGSVTGNLAVTANITSNNIVVTNEASANNLTLSGLANVLTLNVRSNAVVAGNLAVTGNVAVTGNATVTGNVTITGSVAGALSIAGNTTFASNVAMSGNLAVTGNATFNTITSGSWQGTAITPAKGGTGLTASPSAGQILISNGSGFTANTPANGAGIGITANSTAFVINNLGVTTFNTRSGGVTLIQQDVYDALGYVPLNSGSSGSSGSSNWLKTGYDVYQIAAGKPAFGNVAIGFTPAISGSGATFSATVTANVVTAVTATVGGTGYVNSTPLFIDTGSTNPLLGTGFEGSLTTNTSGGITSVTVVSGGTNYASSPGTFIVSGSSANTRLHVYVSQASSNLAIFENANSAGAGAGVNVDFNVANNSANVNLRVNKGSDAFVGGLQYRGSTNTMGILAAGVEKLTVNATAFTTNGVTFSTGNSTVGTLAAGNTVVTGNLTVSGSNVYFNTTNAAFVSANITLAATATNSITANNAGIDIAGASAYLHFDSSLTSWKTNIGVVPATTTAYDLGTSSLYWKNLYANSGTYIANVFIGNTGTANTLTTARQLGVGQNASNGVFLGTYLNDSTYTGSIQVLNGGAGGYLALNANGGNVGIGNTSPANLLHLQGNTAGLQTIYLHNSNTTTNAGVSLKMVEGAPGSNYFGKFEINNTNHYWTFAAGSGVPVVTYTVPNMVWYNLSSEEMMRQVDGSLGVGGTGYPVSELHVYANTYPTGHPSHGSVRPSVLTLESNGSYTGVNFKVNAGTQSYMFWNQKGAGPLGVDLETARLTVDINGSITWQQFSSTRMFIANSVNGGGFHIGTTGGDFSRTWQGMFRNDQNAATRLGVYNATSGASAISSLSIIGGTTNSYLDGNLVDSSGSPYFQWNYGSGVSTVYSDAAKYVWRNAGGGTTMAVMNTTTMGLSTATPGYRLEANVGSLGGTATNQTNAFALSATSSNADVFEVINYRAATGADWTSSEWAMRRLVDGAEKSSIRLGTNNNISFYVSNVSSTIGGYSGPAVIISGNGNICMGNTTPTTNRIDIFGNNNSGQTVRIYNTNTGSSAASIFSVRTGSTAGSSMTFKMLSANAGANGIGQITTGATVANLQIQSQILSFMDQTGVTEYARVDATGLSINAVSIANTLTVTNNISTGNITSTHTGTFANLNVTNTLTSSNSLNVTNFAGIGNSSAAAAASASSYKLYIADSSGLHTPAAIAVENDIGSVKFLTAMNTGTYNAIVQGNEQGIIYSGNSSGVGADSGTFVIGPYSAGTKGIRIDASGNVGIGIAAATSKLTINGSMSATNGTFSDTVTVTKNVNSNNITVTSIVAAANGTFSDTVSVTNNISVSNNITATKNVNSNNVTVTSILAAANGTFSDTVSVTNNISVSNNITATKNVTSNNVSVTTLVSSSNGAFTNKVLIGTTPDSTEALNVNGSINVTGSYKFNGTALNTGAVKQVVVGSNTTQNSFNTIIPYDSTIPQNTEGTEIITATITPTSSSNYIEIEAIAYLSSTSANDIGIISLFQDTTANALTVGHTQFTGTNVVYAVVLKYRMLAGTTSATTFKVRVGTPANIIWYLNSSQSQTGLFGGVIVSQLKVSEVLP